MSKTIKVTTVDSNNKTIISLRDLLDQYRNEPQMWAGAILEINQGVRVVSFTYDRKTDEFTEVSSVSLLLDDGFDD